MGRRDRTDPSELTPREAARRYLRRRESDATEQSVKGWEYRLKLFVEWCEGVGIHRVDEITGYDLDEYYELRSSNVAPATLDGEMSTLKMLVEFLEDLEAVDRGLSESVRQPDVDRQDLSDDTKLRSEHALALLEHYRSSSRDRATRRHAFLELAWFTGARMGGIRGLDVRDAHLEEDPYVEFRHRPDTGTPLKNKVSGERPVAISRTTADVLQEYVGGDRYDQHDDAGRAPLITSSRGRPGTNTLRTISYLATEPCIREPCPHGKERRTCDWTEYSHASKCPSSRSPHQIRTGAITWMLNRGWAPEDVAARVNSSTETIAQHYDKADLEQRRRRLRDRMERRRRPQLDQLEINDV